MGSRCEAGVSTKERLSVLYLVGGETVLGVQLSIVPPPCEREREREREQTPAVCLANGNDRESESGSLTDGSLSLCPSLLCRRHPLPLLLISRSIVAFYRNSVCLCCAATSSPFGRERKGRKKGKGHMPTLASLSFCDVKCALLNGNGETEREGERGKG